MKKAIFWDSDGTLLYGNESFKGGEAEVVDMVMLNEQFRYIRESVR